LMVQEADHQTGRFQGHEYRTWHFDRPVQRHGRSSERTARQRDRPRRSTAPPRRRGVQQRDSDRILGFPDVSKVCMLQSYHQNGEQFEIMFNKTKYDTLPVKIQSIIANAVEAASADMSWKAIHRYSQDISSCRPRTR